MADWKVIGNYAEIAVFAASLAVWLRIAVKGFQGRPPLDLIQQEPPHWETPPVCATFLVAYFLPSFIIYFREQVAGKLDLQSAEAVPWGVACSLVQILTMVGLLRLAGPLRKEDFGCRLAGWQYDVIVGAAGFLASIVPVYVVTTVQQSLQWRQPNDKHDYFKILENDDGSGVLFGVVAAVIVAGPMAEEMLYRVVLQGSVQSQLGLWMAIGFSSVIFCLSHRLDDILPLAPFAIILGYIYYRRRSYVAVVVAHGLFNAFFITLALLQGS